MGIDLPAAAIAWVDLSPIGPFVNAAALNGYEANFRAFAALAQPTVKSSLTTPPGSPSDGDCHLVAVGGGAAWAGWDNRIVRYRAVGATWESFIPKEGWSVYDQATDIELRFTGSAWASSQTFSGIKLSGISVAALAKFDATGNLIPCVGTEAAAFASVSAETGVFNTSVNTMILRDLGNRSLGITTVTGVQATPPGSPTTNSQYLVALTPTGAWIGHAGEIARWNGSAWVYFTISSYSVMKDANGLLFTTAGAGNTGSLRVKSLIMPGFPSNSIGKLDSGSEFVPTSLIDDGSSVNSTIPIGAPAFVKAGGTASQILLADGTTKPTTDFAVGVKYASTPTYTTSQTIDNNSPGMFSVGASSLNFTLGNSPDPAGRTFLIRIPAGYSSINLIVPTGYTLTGNNYTDGPGTYGLSIGRTLVLTCFGANNWGHQSL